MLVIRSIALYLDRTYVIQNSGVRSLWDMGLQLFRLNLSACPEVESKTVSGLLRLIEKERWDLVVYFSKHVLAHQPISGRSVIIAVEMLKIFSLSELVWNLNLSWTTWLPACRMGETVDRSLLKHLLRMFSALGIYSESFERQFLDCTADFYAAEGTRFMQQTDVPDYLKHVEVSVQETESEVNY
jgi:cullin-4